MVPIVLDPRSVRMILVGNGPATVRRLDWLAEGGLTDCPVFSASPGTDLVAAAGERLRCRLPGDEDLADAQLVWIVDLAAAEAADLTAAARRWDAMVNVEDRPGDCDFHNPAVVRRGDLLVGVSTGGRCPGLASLLRRRIGDVLTPRWGQWLDEIEVQRLLWRAQGLGFGAIAAKIEAYVDSRGWLDGFGPEHSGEAAALPTSPRPSPPPGGGEGEAVQRSPVVPLRPIGGEGLGAVGNAEASDAGLHLSALTPARRHA